MEGFRGYHSEWNLGSPGGWDYQRLTQIIAKTVWQKLNKIHNFDLDLDFDDPLFSPVDGFAEIIVDSDRTREDRVPGLIAVVAEEETLEDVTGNKNFAKILSTFDGITGTYRERFHDEIVRRTPWTRQFYARSTSGPAGEAIVDIVEWTRNHFETIWPKTVG